MENLSHVLHYKSSFFDIFTSAEPPTFVTRLDGINMHVLVKLKTAIAARLSNGTNLGHTVLGN